MSGKNIKNHNNSKSKNIRKNKKNINKLNKKSKTKNTKKSSNQNDYDKKIKEIRNALEDNYLQQKKLMNEMKELMKKQHQEIKLIKGSGDSKQINEYSDFNQRQNVPKSLRKLLKLDDQVMLSRSAIVNLLYQYFTKHKMYNSKNKKQIIPNDEIRKIFGMKEKDELNFYNIQTWLRKILI